MAGNTDNDYQPSPEVTRDLEVLRADYTSVEGKPFTHFFCPILLKDEPVPLCMGHIVNEAIPNSFGGRVIQRKDVDNWYGSLAEADFATNIQARSMTPAEILEDPSMRRKLQTKIAINGEIVPHYEFQGSMGSGHTPITVHTSKGQALQWVLKSNPEELGPLDDRSFELRLGKDSRLAAFVSLVKAGYLTMFKLLGYTYGLSASGIEIGHCVLGKFFAGYGHKKPTEAIKDAAEFFKPYVNMMRAVVGFTGGQPPLGTVEDGQAHACVTPGGKFFATVVWIRTNSHHHAVLLPAFSEPDGASAYYNFMTNSNQTLRVHSCKFVTGRVLVSQQSREILWPKGDGTFGFV